MRRAIGGELQRESEVTDRLVMEGKDRCGGIEVLDSSRRDSQVLRQNRACCGPDRQEALSRSQAGEVDDAGGRAPGINGEQGALRTP